MSQITSLERQSVKIVARFRGAMYQTNSSGAHVLVISDHPISIGNPPPQLDMVTLKGNQLVFTGSFYFDRTIGITDDRYSAFPVTNDVTTKIAYVYAIAQSLDREYNTTKYTDCLKRWLSSLLGVDVDFNYTETLLSAYCNIYAMGALLFLPNEKGVPGLVSFVFSPASLLIITDDEVCPLNSIEKEQLLQEKWIKSEGMPPRD